MESHAKADAAFWELAESKMVHYRGPFLPYLIERAEGSYIYDSNGRRILDFTSGQMSSILGHGHPEIAAVVADSYKNLDHLFSNFLSWPAVNLAKALTDRLPAGLDKAMFLSTGGESNEAAIKLAKLYTGKFEVVGLNTSWHGSTAAAGACTYQPDRRGYGPNVGHWALPCPNAYRSIFRHADGSHDWQTELDYGWSMIDAQTSGSLACCIVEPVLSSGGVFVLPDGYLKRLQEHCHKRGMLLIIDEAQTGIGRTGTFCAFETSGIVPDILTLSKTLGAGLPLSAVITSTEIEEVCAARDYSFYTTHVSDPLVASVGLEVIRIVERDNLAQRAAILGERFRGGLRELQKRFPCIGDVRGIGLMIGLEIVKDPVSKEADEARGSEMARILFDLGLSANVTAKKGTQSCFRIAPPLNSTEAQIDEALRMFEQALELTEK